MDSLRDNELTDVNKFKEKINKAVDEAKAAAQRAVDEVKAAAQRARERSAQERAVTVFTHLQHYEDELEHIKKAWRNYIYDLPGFHYRSTTHTTIS